jgi:UDP-2,3-diacylglucosamine hydrolase
VTTLFISDLHLDGSRPDITDQFLEFMRCEAAKASALYILGDLFEAWIGDDDPDADKARALNAIRQVTAGGVPCYVMHGNRDFLLGKRFCRNTGARLLADGTVVDLYGERVLLMHGDTLCTDDPAYQRLRRIVRNPFVKLVLRSLSLRQRQRLAEKMRAGSKAHIESMDKSTPYIMDVNSEAVTDTFRRYGVEYLVHGHTHRPAVHDLLVDGHKAVRIVLGDWHDQGSVLRWDEQGFDLVGLGRT